MSLKSTYRWIFFQHTVTIVLHGLRLVESVDEEPREGGATVKLYVDIQLLTVSTPKPLHCSKANYNTKFLGLDSTAETT